jgi:hypothetical protein
MLTPNLASSLRAKPNYNQGQQDRAENDPDGTYLPDEEAALSYADYTIRELRKKSVYEDDLSLMMIVKDQAGHEPG